MLQASSDILNPNYAALCLSIVSEKSIDRSLRAIGIAPERHFMPREKLKQRVIEICKRYKNEQTPTQIAEAMNIRTDIVYVALYKAGLRERTGGETNAR
jgi:hypothetical protein